MSKPRTHFDPSTMFADDDTGMADTPLFLFDLQATSIPWTIFLAFNALATTVIGVSFEDSRRSQERVTSMIKSDFVTVGRGLHQLSDHLLHAFKSDAADFGHDLFNLSGGMINTARGDLTTVARLVGKGLASVSAFAASVAPASPFRPKPAFTNTPQVGVSSPPFDDASPR